MFMLEEIFRQYFLKHMSESSYTLLRMMCIEQQTFCFNKLTKLNRKSLYNFSKFHRTLIIPCLLWFNTKNNDLRGVGPMSSFRKWPWTFIHKPISYLHF